MNKAPSHILWLVRHGESAGNASGIIQGQADYPLTPLGLEQSHRLVRRLKEDGVACDRVITSPLLRARRMAEILAAELGVPFEIDNDWLERDTGQITGMESEEVAHKFPHRDQINPYQPYAKTGESEWDLYIRAGRAVQGLLRRESGTYLVITHGGFLKRVLRVTLGIVPEPNLQGAHFRTDNAGVSIFEYYPEDHIWYVRAINDTCHLNGLVRGEDE